MPRSMSLGRRVAPALLAALLVLAGIWVLSQRSVARLARTAREAERTYAVVRTLEQSYAQLAAAESHARGYSLTADAGYLAAYDEARARAEAHLATLRALTAAHPRE